MKIGMADRRTMVRNHAKEYQRRSKGQKSRILGVFVKATGYNRTYAARLLRGEGRRVWLKPGVAVQGDIGLREKRSRPKVYGPKVLKPLKQIWEFLDYLCGKRLAAQRLASGEFVWPGATRALLWYCEEPFQREKGPGSLTETREALDELADLLAQRDGQVRELNAKLRTASEELEDAYRRLQARPRSRIAKKNSAAS